MAQRFEIWGGRRHPLVGNGRALQLWKATVTKPCYASSTVLCDTLPEAVEFFTAQPWAKGAGEMTLEEDGLSYHLYRTATGWVLPANGQRPQECA